MQAPNNQHQHLTFMHRLPLLHVQTLRRQVQHSRDRRSKPDAAYVQELELQRLIGKGGFGTVYSGTWQGSPVAFKVRGSAFPSLCRRCSQLSTCLC